MHGIKTLIGCIKILIGSINFKLLVLSPITRVKQQQQRKNGLWIWIYQKEIYIYNGIKSTRPTHPNSGYLAQVRKKKPELYASCRQPLVLTKRD